MPYTKIPASATAAGRSASSHLAHCLHKNRLYLDNFRQCITALQATGAGGHLHTTGNETTEFTLADHVTLVANESDRFDFYYGGGSHAPGLYAAELVAATYDIPDLAQHLQNKMRQIVGTTLGVASNTVKITVDYDLEDESLTRGKIIIRHTGTTDSPETRVLKLPLATGANGPTGTARSAATKYGYAQRDRIGAFGHVGDSGFLHGFLLDTFTLGDGGLVDSDGLQASCATTSKFASGVVSTDNIADGAVGTTNIVDASVTGPKIGTPTTASLSVSSLNFNSTASMTVPGKDNSSKVPAVVVWAASGAGAPPGFLKVTAKNYISGSNWVFTIYNATGNNLDVCLSIL